MDFKINFKKIYYLSFMLLHYIKHQQFTYLINYFIFRIPFFTCGLQLKKTHMQKGERKTISKMLQREVVGTIICNLYDKETNLHRKRTEGQALNLHDETNFNWWSKFHCRQSNSLASSNKSTLEVKNSYLHFQCYYLRCPFSSSYFTKE